MRLSSQLFHSVNLKIDPSKGTEELWQLLLCLLLVSEARPFVYACNHHKTLLINSSARVKSAPHFDFTYSKGNAYGALMYCFNGEVFTLTKQLADICLTDECGNHSLFREGGWPAKDNNRQISPDPLPITIFLSKCIIRLGNCWNCMHSKVSVTCNQITLTALLYIWSMVF